MSNFSDLFSQAYSNENDYDTARDNLLEAVENQPLQNGVAGAGAYGYGVAYTIGYGYDISQQTGQQIISDFEDAGIFNDTNETGIYNTLYNNLIDYNNGTGHKSVSLATINNNFISAFGGSNGLTQAQAQDLLDVAASRIETTVSNTAATITSAFNEAYATDYNALHELLLSEDYNGGGIFGTNQVAALSTDNIADFLKDYLFFNNTGTISGVSGYHQSLENRRLEDLANVLGTTVTSTTDADGNFVVTGLNFNGNIYSAVDTNTAIVQYGSQITNQINSLIQDNAAASNLTSLESNLLQAANQTLTGEGYYAPESINATLTGGSGPSTFVFSPGDGHDEITNFSTAKGDQLWFYPVTNLTLGNLSATVNDNVNLVVTYDPQGDSVKIDNFFTNTTPTVITENGQTVSFYQFDMELENQTVTASVEVAGSLLATNPTATLLFNPNFGTYFTVQDEESQTDIGTGTSNTLDLSNATGSIIVNLLNQLQGTVTGGDPINDTLVNIQNVIGNAGDDTIAGNSLNLTVQNSTSTAINGTNDTISIGGNDTLIVSAAPGETSFQDTINASTTAANLTTDVINFEGQSIAGTVSSGGTDAYGRAYVLNSTTLTVSHGQDKLTLNNFQNGDYGVYLGTNSLTIQYPGQGRTGELGPSNAGINDSGIILGGQVALNNTLLSFTYNNGTYSTLPQGFNGNSINNNGEILDGYDLLLYNNGVITSIAPSLSAGLSFSASGFNDSNVIVGEETESNGTLFSNGTNSQAVIDIGGTLTAIAFPASYYPPVYNGIVATPIVTGINDSGVIIGSYSDNSYEYGENGEHGFIDNAGSFTTVNDPNAAPSFGTYVIAINNNGVVAGYYFDIFDHFHGFIDNGGIFTDVFAPDGSPAIVSDINDRGEIIGISSATGKSFLESSQTIVQAVSQSNTTLNVAASQSTAVTGTALTLNIGANANVTANVSNSTVNTQVADNTYVNGHNNTATVSQNDPLTISGYDNTVTVSGSNVEISDDAISYSNSFTIQSGSTGDSLVLSGANDIVSDASSGNAITALGDGDTLAVGSNDTLTLTGSNTVSGSSGADLTTDALTFDGQSVAGNFTSGSAASDGLTYTLSGTTLSIADGSDTLTVNNFANGDFSVNVSGLTPIAENDNIDAANQSSVSGNVLADNGNGADSDPSGLALSTIAESLTTANGGTFTLGTDGSFTYTAATGFRGSDSATYTLEDTAGLTSTGTVNISNIFTNRAPTALAETFDAQQQAGVFGNVLAGNSDPDGDSISAIAQSLTTANGNAVTINADGSFTLQAATGFRGTDSFTYTDEDSYGAMASNTVTVDNLFTNRAPVTALETVDAAHAAMVSGNVLANGSDPDGDSLSAVAQTLVTANGGTVTIASSGAFTYTAANGFRGNDSFDYTAEDSYGATTAGAVDINNVFTNSAPTANAETFDAAQSATVSGNVLAGNSDPDGDSISAIAQNLTTANGNTVTINADGSFTLQAATGFRGADSFTYTDEDSYGATASNTVTISNLFTNRAPVTALETVDTAHAATANGNVLANDSDPDGDTLNAVAQTIITADGGTVTIASTGAFSYAAATGFRGNDSFTYTAEDSYGATTVGTVDVNNVFTNRAPTANAETFNASNQASVSGNVLTGNNDPDGDTISAVAQSLTTTNGNTVTINADGSFTLQAAAGFRGTDSFAYTDEDSYGAVSSGTVTVNNLFTNRAPVTVLETVNANNSAVATGNVLANDTDPDGDALSAVAQNLTTANGGTVTVNADGSFSYTAATGFRSNDSFGYTAEDSYGATTAGTVDINNVFTNRAPTANAETFDATQQGSLSGNVLTGNSDPDGDTISAVAQSLTTANGNTVTINADGSFTLQAATGFRGTDSFTYTDEDSYGAESAGTVTVNNLFTNRAPVTVLETVNANNQPSVTGNVLTNDSDPDGDTLSAVAQTLTTTNGGTVTIASNGAFTYTAGSGFSGNDSFSYTAQDSYGATTAGTVNVTNIVANLPPVANADSFTANYGQAITGNVLANDTDPDGDALHVVQSSVTTADGFTIALNANGSFSYTPEAGFVGTDSFSYTAADPYGATSNATVTLNVTAPSGAVVGTSGNDNLSGPLFGGMMFGLAGNDTFTDSLLGADTMFGGQGNDTYFVNNANDVIVENPDEGNDLVQSSVSYTLSANVENLTLTGLFNLSGTASNVAGVITGNTGSDTLSDGTGAAADTLIGNSTFGTDTFIVNNAGDTVIENNNWGLNAALVESSINYTLGANVENLTLLGSANLTGTGNALTNVITGNTGNDVLVAGSGITTLVGNSSSGADTFVVNNTSDTVFENHSGTAALVKSSVNWTLGANVENLVLTGSSNLIGKGNSVADTITGNTGNDVLIAGTGAATLIGNSSSGDTFVVNSASDTVIETHSGAAGVVQSSANWALGANTNRLTLTGSSNLAGTAGNAAAVITGNSGSDTLSDGTGAAADTLIGNSTFGTDTFIVNNTGDSITETNNWGLNSALVESSVNWTLGNNLQKLTLTGSGITGTLNNGTDTITDASAHGGDTLVGGTGADDFVLASAGVYNNIDVIKNFSTAHGDKIDVSALIPGYVPFLSNLADYVKAVNSGSDSLLQVDSTGTGNHFQTVATITGVTNINVPLYALTGNLVA